MKQIILIPVCCLLFLNVLQAQVSIKQEKRKVLLENEFTRLIFNLDSGKYDAVTIPKGEKYLVNAVFTIESLTSSNPSLKYSWKEEPVDDRIGKGRKLVITGSKPGLPEIIFEATLYPGKTFIVLGCGLNNNAGYPVRIKSFHPLSGKIKYTEGEKDLFFLLDGNAGGENTFVTNENRLQSRNNLLCVYGSPGNRSSIVIGGLTYNEFEKYAILEKNVVPSVNDETTIILNLDIFASDPVGKLVEKGTIYIPDDKFYVDFGTSNPLESLDQYGQMIRKAQNIRLNMYDFPTLCLWYSGMDQYGGGEKNNDSPGAVVEMEKASGRGILDYTRFAVRLVPDNLDQQGWWDDEHFQNIGNTANFIGPCYKPPYETTEKWAQAVTDLGGIPFMYSRSGFRAEDFSRSYPGYMLFNNSSRSIDFTDPGLIKHLEEVYTSWRNAGIKGMMFDYPGSGWSPDGGFEDTHSTAAEAYRNMFKLAFENLGPDSYIQENKLSRGSDITLGVVASQRTAGDADEINPLMVTRDGLRWYKNRVVVNYDKDAKNPFHARPLNADGWRTMLTMSYVTGGRFLLGTSLSKIGEEQFHDLTRIFPYHYQPESFRPVDAFTGKKDPQVYDFAINPDWHQVALYNTTLDDPAYTGTENHKYPAGNYIPAEIKIVCSGEPGFGAIGLDRDRNYHVYDFWNEKYVGRISGKDTLIQSMRPGETRMLSIHAVESNPQLISTNRHIMQGYVDMVEISWHEKKKELSGISKVAAGETYKIVISCNGREITGFKAGKSKALWEVTDRKNSLATLFIESSEGGKIGWSVSFK